MTAQIHDRVRYRGKTYSISGVKGEGLFDPYDHKLVLRPCNTALWRGYLCVYKVTRDQISLDELSLCLHEEPPALFGVDPGESKHAHGFDAVYKSIGWKVPFTGGLLLGRDFIQELYVHMGFHPAWKFRQVHELIFEAGDLLEAHDRTEEIAAVRREMRNKPQGPFDVQNQMKAEEWIKKSFSLDYDL
jgi:hypothetical protein